MLQQDSPEDFVLATGETHPVREFVEKSFSLLGMNIKWAVPALCPYLADSYLQVARTRYRGGRRRRKVGQGRRQGGLAVLPSRRGRVRGPVLIGIAEGRLIDPALQPLARQPSKGREAPRMAA